MTLRLIRGDAEPSEAPLDLVATAARLEPGRPVKRPVEGLSIYRPHLKFRPADRHDAWTIATDPASGLRVELAVDLASGTQEDDR